MTERAAAALGRPSTQHQEGRDMPAFRDIFSGAAPFGAVRSVVAPGGGIGGGTEPAVTYPTRSGTLAFEPNGYPTDKTLRHLQEEIDYQRAVQAYIHYLPAVAVMQWRNAHFGPLGGGGGDLIVYRTTEQKLPILAADGATTFVVGFAELAETDGVLVYNVPSGPTAGAVLDIWQRPVSETGTAGPDAGRGGRFLIVLDGTEVPEDHGADFVIASKTSTIMVATRILTSDPQESERVLKAHRIHALGAQPAARIFEAPNSDWSGHQPRGLDYWIVVHQILQLNPLDERDMAVLQWLKNVGLEKGRAFEPTATEENVLEEAAFVGEAWAMGNSFLERAPARDRPNEPVSQWQDMVSVQSPLDQMAGTHMEIDARAADAYRAIPVATARPIAMDDAGTRYLTAYKDSAGRWLDGAKTYELVMYPDGSAPAFWAVVLYDNDTRCMIENAQGKTEVNSRQQLVADEDGAVRLVFGPARPDGVPAANWIQTNPEKGFFAHLRLHAPAAPFVDRSWRIGSIEEATSPFTTAYGAGQ
ncbi:MAG: DUF1214 domain-containing protein [Paracoccaceae bacterium]|jgi:hypothetical protein|nr:DUF1214 domain-containing protein [Paracoccaceae bacterium]